MSSETNTKQTKAFLQILEEEFRKLSVTCYRRAFIFKLTHALIMLFITMAGLVTSIQSSNIYEGVATWLISGLGTFVVVARTCDSLLKFEPRGVSNAQVYLRACVVCDEITRKLDQLVKYEQRVEEEIKYALVPSPIPEIITPKYVALLVNHIFKEFDSLRLTPYTDNTYERIVQKTPNGFVEKIAAIKPTT
jgi:hypothetical protein